MRFVWRHENAKTSFSFKAMKTAKILISCLILNIHGYLVQTVMQGEVGAQKRSRKKDLMQSWLFKSLFLEAVSLGPEVFVVESSWQARGLLLIWKVNPIPPCLVFLIIRKIILSVCLLWRCKQLGHIIFLNGFLYVVNFTGEPACAFSLATLSVGQMALLLTCFCWRDLL